MRFFKEVINSLLIHLLILHYGVKPKDEKHYIQAALKDSGIQGDLARNPQKRVRVIIQGHGSVGGDAISTHWNKGGGIYGDGSGRQAYQIKDITDGFKSIKPDLAKRGTASLMTCDGAIHSLVDSRDSSAQKVAKNLGVRTKGTIGISQFGYDNGNFTDEFRNVGRIVRGQDGGVVYHPYAQGESPR